MWSQARQGYPPRPVGALDPEGYWVSREVYERILRSISLSPHDPNNAFIPTVNNGNWSGRATLSNNQFVQGAYGTRQVSAQGNHPRAQIQGNPRVQIQGNPRVQIQGNRPRQSIQGSHHGHGVYGGQFPPAGTPVVHGVYGGPFPPAGTPVVHGVYGGQFPPAGTPVVLSSLDDQIWLPRHPLAGSMGMVVSQVPSAPRQTSVAGNSNKKVEERKADEEKKKSEQKANEEKKKSERERALQLQKRQETVRLARQADIEGWSDERLVFALRLRNTVHHELRDKVTPVENH